MNKLMPMLQRQFPQFEATHTFEAGIPVYFVRIEMEVLEKQALNSFEQYILQAVALGVNTAGLIAHLLGVEERDLIGPIASLLRNEFIEQAQGAQAVSLERALSLTSKGQKALELSGPPAVPRKKSYRLHFNALTWSAIPREEATWSVDNMCKEGMFVIPPREKTDLTLGDFTEADVKAALAGVSGFANLELVALLELKQAQLEYIAPVAVVLLQHQEAGERRVAVCRNSVYLAPESFALQRLLDAGKLTLPSDIASLKDRGLDLPIRLPEHIATTVQRLVQNERAMRELETQLGAQEMQRTATQDDRERRYHEERIRELSEELRLAREDNVELRHAAQQNHVEFLSTEQHRPRLERALREAQNEIIIISPWMNRKACNDALCRLIGDAIARGVRIRIGYGMGQERDAHEAERNRWNVQLVREALNRFIPRGQHNQLDMRDTHGTHQKILICDRKFAVTGSFNWLSYLGLQDDGYRNETGTVFYDADPINQLAAIAEEALDKAEWFDN